MKKYLTTVLNSHHMSRVLCGEPQSIPCFLAPPTPDREVNPELSSRQLSLLDSPSSASHGYQHSLLIFTAGSTHHPLLCPCSRWKQLMSDGARARHCPVSVPNPTALPARGSAVQGVTAQGLSQSHSHRTVWEGT